MTDPKITVVMLTRNSDAYLHGALDSLLNQTYKNFELLIVDSNSTDDTIKIINSYKDARIRLIRDHYGDGIGLARKYSMTLAKGKYIAVLDSDDIAFEDRLQIECEYLDSHEDVHLVGSTILIINEKGKLERVDHAITNPLAIRWKLLFQNCISHSTVMFRKDFALKVGGYDGEINTGEDFDLWIRFAAFGKITQFDRPMAKWRRHNLSATALNVFSNKDQDALTVMKSIKLQTNMDVPFAIARCLLGYFPESHVDDDTVLKAYDVVLSCWCHIQSESLSNEERAILKVMAIKEILRVAIKASTSFRTVAGAIKYAAKIDPLFIFNIGIIYYTVLNFLNKVLGSRINKIDKLQPLYLRIMSFYKG